MKKIQHLARKIAPTESNILITGETGTGKELVARAIHALSLRTARPFVAVNASAIPENLQESELFGHRKGAFTGAMADRRGLFEEASSGTLFLDEIGDTSLGLQVKLLRALENRVIRRVGDSGERGVDVRVIAATNRDLVELVRKGEFREDLFFRLNVIHMHLPPLRERAGDLELLLENFLARHAQRHHNIRELDNIVHHAVLMAEGPRITTADLPPYLFDRPRLAGYSPHVVEAVSDNGLGMDLSQGFISLAQMEKTLIEATLGKLERNQSLAAKKLGISRSTLWRKMKEYGIAA
jgi:transcriptional regulator with PAS, ATPase and Fis domain